MRGPSARFPDALVTLNLLPRPLLEISSQELPTRLVHKTSMRNLGAKSPDISGPLGKTSVKDLLKVCERPPHKTSMRDLYTRPPEIPGPPRSLHRSSLQDLFTRPL